MELKPCPFCGGKAHHYKGNIHPYGVACEKCCANINIYGSKGATTRAWNRRAEPKHAHWIINGDWGECSRCHETSKLSVMEHKDYCPACGAIMDEESVVNHP